MPWRMRCLLLHPGTTCKDLSDVSCHQWSPHTPDGITQLCGAVKMMWAAINGLPILLMASHSCVGLSRWCELPSMVSPYSWWHHSAVWGCQDEAQSNWAAGWINKRQDYITINCVLKCWGWWWLIGGDDCPLTHCNLVPPCAVLVFGRH